MNGYNFKSQALFELHKYEKCLICADNALKIDPKNIDLLVTKSSALLNLDKFDECVYNLQTKLLK